MIGIIRTVVDSTLPTGAVYHLHRLAHRMRGLRKPWPILEKFPDPPVVLAGPFKGLVFTKDTYSSAVVASLLGTYELELHEAVERICRSQPDLIVDIGAGEGYYAVGMAMRNPQAKNVSFEMFKPAKHLLKRVIRANKLSDRMTVLGKGTPEKLQSVLAPAKKPLVICDCEGAEDFLLDPERIGALRKSTVLVELHDHMCAGVSGRIRGRFASSHEIVEYHTRVRTKADLPAGWALSDAEIEQYIEEKRGVPMTWFLMAPKQA